MNIITNPDRLRGFARHIKVEKISRRSILKGLGIAGGLVLAAPVTSRQAFAAYKTGADKMPHGPVGNPAVFVPTPPAGIVPTPPPPAPMRSASPHSIPPLHHAH